MLYFIERVITNIKLIESLLLLLYHSLSVISDRLYSVDCTDEVMSSLRQIPCLDAVAHGGNHGSCSWGEPPHEGTASLKTLLPIAYCLLPIAYCLLPIALKG